MSEHKAMLKWQRTTADFSYATYNRDHLIHFDNGAELKASAAQAYLGNPACVDPEETFVGALSSCHLLTFLAIAAKKRFVVDTYQDEAFGILDKNAEGKLAVVKVILHPQIIFSGDSQPTAEQLRQLHDLAHDSCFIANSVKTEVVVAT